MRRWVAVLGCWWVCLMVVEVQAATQQELLTDILAKADTLLTEAESSEVNLDSLASSLERSGSALSVGKLWRQMRSIATDESLAVVKLTSLIDTVNNLQTRLGTNGMAKSTKGAQAAQLWAIAYYDSLLADALLVSGQVDSTETLTVANTEYSVDVPAGTRYLEFNCRTATPTIRWSYVTGKVAGSTNPYNSLLPGLMYCEERFTGGYKPAKIYFASATAGAVVEIRFKK